MLANPLGMRSSEETRGVRRLSTEHVCPTISLPLFVKGDRRML